MDINSTHRNLRNRAEVKHSSEQEHEHRNRQIRPLHILQTRLVAGDICKENVGAQYRRNHSPYSIECLRKVDPQLTVLRGTADREIRVRSRLERSQTIACDENSDAKAPERTVY